ncbi:NAD(P)/FAD-dependent oxidoreductase [Mucilaginibacter sp.]|uniref:NAD(P)/FAD-dependent oxidoreductase n=1 Tax=Mucilaginibacter sp. TaxID=1882438 RepID=UPI0025CE7A1F|nr:NAD(P)/FAD-dependent oxidoreductase [Mucilaginibacter sp.]
MENLKEFDNREKIIVVGGGFAGLSFARLLFKNKHYQVTLVDKNNYNYFTPLLYQVATSFLDPSSISYPFRKMFRDKGVRFRMAELLRVDTENKTIQLSDGALSYDHLVFAAGTKTNFFGNEGIREKAISIKGIDDALYMRNELMKTMEKAVIETDPAERKRLLTIVVAGGGPTGVEIAGMLAEMKRYILGKDYPELKGAGGSIHIVDGTSVLLAPMSDKTHKEAYQALTELDVKIKLNTRVNSYDGHIVKLSDGGEIETKTLIWAAGVTSHTFEGIPETSLGAGNRMVTNAYNQVTGLDNVWAIGDISIQETDAAYPKGHPQLAQPAIQQGKALAKNFLAIAKGKPMEPFKYFDRGDMAIIGRNTAVADLLKHKLHFSGFLGLFSWLFIHLISLVNYNNKIKTLYSWLVAYTTRDQALRMIFRSENRGT